MNRCRGGEAGEGVAAEGGLDLCPKCGAARPGEALECPRCGVVFRKFRPAGSPVSGGQAAGPTSTLGSLLRGTSGPVHPMLFGGRVAVLAGFVGWSFFFVTAPLEANVAGRSFLHGVNLLFHEAGHVIFGLFGEFLRVLGGTLGQLVMPTLCWAALLFRQRDGFGASVALWWVGENLLDIAPYVNDARAQKLMLLGGVTGRDVPGYHDWTWLLGRLGWLGADHGIATAVHVAGVGLMLLALGWGGAVLVGQARRLSWEGEGGP